MDMKRILQALDKASSRKVEGADDMRRFVSAVRALNTPVVEAGKPVGLKPAGKVTPISKTSDTGQLLKTAGVPILDPVQAPPMPTGTLEPGTKLEPQPNGTTVYSGGFGAYTYDKAGKPIKYTSPSFSGITQTNDLVTGNITVRYIAGPLDITANFDKTGKPLDNQKVQMDLGLGVMGVEKDKGITATTWQDRGNNVIQSRDMVKDPATYDRAMKQVNAPATEGKKSFADYLQMIEEGLKDPKDNPCWKGYKPVGTKKKGGKTVPNCVPKE